MALKSKYGLVVVKDGIAKGIKESDNMQSQMVSEQDAASTGIFGVVIKEKARQETSED